MISGEASATVKASPAEVLDFVTDLHRYKQADTKIRRVLKVEDDGDDRVVTFLSLLRGIPTPPTTQRSRRSGDESVEVTDEPGLTSPFAAFSASFTCQSTSEGTVVHHREQLEIKGPIKIPLELYLKDWWQKDVAAEMKRLAAYVDGQDEWSLVAKERRKLAKDLDQLTAEDWKKPSLCAGWTVRDVASHLALPLGKRIVDIMPLLVAYRFDFDRLTVEETAKDRRTGPELITELEAHADWRLAPPGMGPAAPLTDVIVHGQDIRRPLGIPYDIEPDTARTVLDFAASPKATRGFVKKGHLDGITWRTTDLDWSHGTGATVEGPAEAVLMAMLGRRDAYKDLSGPGVETLEAR